MKLLVKSDTKVTHCFHRGIDRHFLYRKGLASAKADEKVTHHSQYFRRDSCRDRKG